MTDTDTLTTAQQRVIRHAADLGEYVARRDIPVAHEVAMSLVGLGLFEHIAGLSTADVFELTERGWGVSEALEREQR